MYVSGRQDLLYFLRLLSLGLLNRHPERNKQRNRHAKFTAAPVAELTSEASEWAACPTRRPANLTLRACMFCLINSARRSEIGTNNIILSGYLPQSHSN